MTQMTYQLIPPPKLQKTKLLQKLSQKYRQHEWQQFDDLQRRQRDKQKFSQDDEQFPQQKQKSKKIKQPNKKQKKLQQIQQYQRALDKLRKNNFYYHNPFEKQRLNLQYMPVLRMLEQAFQNELQLQATLRRMGLKTVKILFKTGAHTSIGFMLSYLKQDRLPKWLLQRYRDLMKKKDNQFTSDQNTLLRKMSNTQNTCLEK